MALLFHPAAGDITLAGILHALADPVRVRIFAEIARAEESRPCTGVLEVCEKPVPKSTLSQHFKVLREAGLIRSERRGVELHSTVRHEDLRERFGDLIAEILAAYTSESERTTRSERARQRRRSGR